MHTDNSEETIKSYLEVYFSKSTDLELNKVDLRQKLVGLVQKMIDEDFPALVQFLYRIDVSEAELKFKLKNAPIGQSSEVIVDAIIARQEAKWKARQSFPQANDIPEEERW